MGNLTLERVLNLVFILLLMHGLYAISIGWNDPIDRMHSFRQSQTAIAVDRIAEGGSWIAYEVPVLGPPWSIPFEFPVYQWIAALFAVVFGAPVEQAGRSVSALFFFGSVIPAYFLLRRLGLSNAERMIPLSLFIASPLYLFWSRAVMIESCALFFSILYLALAAEYLAKPKPMTAILALAAGSLAAMVKITTFFGFAICGACLFLADRYRRRGQADSSHLSALGFIACAGVLPTLSGYLWSLYAEAIRVQNPLAGFLSLDALAEFNYGTAALRLSPEFWQVVWSRSITDILGSNLLILPVLICLPLIGRERRFSLVSAVVFFSVLLTFTSLHFIHNYYQYANGLFLIGAVGFCIAGLIRREGPARVSGLILFGTSLALALHQYHVSFADEQDLDNTDFRAAAEAIQARSAPDDIVMVYGLDWSAELLHASKRRGIMVRDPKSDESLQKLISNLEGNKVGAMAVCLAERANPIETNRRTCTYGFEDTPQFEDSFCAVYFPSSRRDSNGCSQPTTSILPADPPLGNVDLPAPGNTVTKSIEMVGWALSRAGVRSIDFYLDDRQVGTARLRVPRPDVQTAYPAYPDSLHGGFQGSIDLVGIKPGSHILRVEVHTNDGLRHDLAKIPLTVT